MAIPSFSGVDMSAYNSGEYSEYLQGLAEYLGLSYGDISRELQTLKDLVALKQNVINTDGLVDLNKLPVATAQMWKTAQVDIYGSPDDQPVYFGWVDGVKTLIFGEMAIPYIEMASLPGEQLIIAPNLVLLDQSGIVATGIDGEGGSLQVLSFAASFMTIYGETALSNVVFLGPLLEWSSVTLGVVTEDIPSYAISVIYYRDFGGVFRKVTEVKLNGNT